MHYLPLKPISVNEMYIKGKIKSPQYRRLERDALLMMPNFKLPEPPYLLLLVVGIAPNADASNYIKPQEDIIQLKYGVNDRYNYRLIVDKIDCKPKDKFFAFEILQTEKRVFDFKNKCLV